ncbi:hypothetical protein [uncultured Draconibacterium sp.]|uniref:hypothetical protein n=1 Tax=uncultured Draconibacterium sp. TaxID=1573823 RepID=UPI003218008C
MRNQDSNKDFNVHLKTEFKKIDELIAKFTTELAVELSILVKRFYPTIQFNKALKEQLIIHATQIFNCADSVYDKDQNYNETRMSEELVSVTRILEMRASTPQNKTFAIQSHTKVKQIVIKYFPNTIDLSANGFRLLERSCLMHNHEFLYLIQDKQNN